MELNDVIKEKKTKRFCLRTTPTIKNWMKEQGISQQKVFDMAVRELMEGEENA